MTKWVPRWQDMTNRAFRETVDQLRVLLEAESLLVNDKPTGLAFRIGVVKRRKGGLEWNFMRWISIARARRRRIRDGKEG